MKKSLFALASGTFALGIAEFIMMGILGKLAQDLGISVTECGHLISAYASGVCFGALFLLFMRKMPLKTLMMLFATLIAVGNICAALSPGFWTLFASRFVSGLPHGAFFGVGAIVARRLSAPGREVQAVSMVIAGMTVATLCGVPLGTFLTNNFSWRIAFGVVGLCGVFTLVAIKVWVPDVGKLAKVSFMGQFRFMATLPPWLIFGGVLCAQTGLYCWYSYVDPLLVHVARFTTADLSWLMVVGGAGMLVGNLLSGKLGLSFKPAAVASGIMFAGIPVLLAIYFFSQIQWLSVLLLFMGTGVLFGSGSPLQSSIVGYSKGGEMLGAAMIQIAYNAGNAIAAWLGGMGIAMNHQDYRFPAMMGVPLVAIGAILILILYFRNERGRDVTV
ncbi:MAG: MFS transporter [Muribaculaceae bacterium]|nr:MFS transporter [Muribaculaceae bacterium]